MAVQSRFPVVDDPHIPARGLRGALAEHPYWLAAALALVVRIALIFIRRTYLFDSPDPYAFGVETGSIARSIALGHGFGSPFRDFTGPSAWIAPIYPYMVAAVFKLFGVYTRNAAIVMLSINSVFSALTCVAIGGVADRTVGRRIGVWTALAWAALPHFAKWPTEWVWDMALSALLAACAMWLTLVLAENLGSQTQRRRDAESFVDRIHRAFAPLHLRPGWIAFGTLWAVIALSNPALLTLLPFCGVYLIAKLHPTQAKGRLEWGTLARNAGVAALVCAALIAPWMVRNRVVLGRWVFIRDNFGFEFHLGNYHDAIGMGWGGIHPSMNKREFELYRRVGEVAYVDLKTREAMQFVRQHPDEFLALCRMRVAAFWNGDAWGYWNHPWFPWTVGTFAAFSLISCFGLLWTVAKRVPGSLLFWWMPLYPLPYYLTYPQTRYRHAIEPEMLLVSVFFVAAVAGALKRIFSRRKGEMAAVAAAK